MRSETLMVRSTAMPCVSNHEATDARPHAKSGVRRPSTDSLRWPLALVGERVGFLAQRDPHRRARKLEEFTQGVDEIAKVGLRHRVRARAEQDETRRPRLGLCNVI